MGTPIMGYAKKACYIFVTLTDMLFVQWAFREPAINTLQVFLEEA
jgi:hypothetical protein